MRGFTANQCNSLFANMCDMSCHHLASCECGRMDLRAVENGTDRRDDEFRIRFMNTELDEGGVRFKIVYLPQRKEWNTPQGIQKFDDKPYPRVNRHGKTIDLFLEQATAGVLDPGFYIRVEGGMSSTVHCRVIDDLYRSP